ncbi:MAG: GNAT family N-acetyltransferase [Armatimonadetes bacterium]|nr:GNAT family N-acetyltransferase [Armatimonadota bacterium]
MSETLVRDYRPGDEERMMDIAPRAFAVWARYGLDYQLDRQRVAEEYREEARGYAERAQAGAKDMAIFVAERDGVVAGYIVVLVDKQRSERFGVKWGTLRSLAVDPDLHHGGIGKALVARAMQWFREQGCEYLEVTTDLNNVAALRLYEGAGFRALYASLTLTQRLD